MTQFGLEQLDTEALPVFEEATQTAARFLAAPICTFGIPQGQSLMLKAAVGLSQLGFMNPLARTRKLPIDDVLVSRILQKKQRLVIADTLDQPPFAASVLIQQHDVRAYLGVPLITSTGDCIGILAVMDLAPRAFSEQAIAFLEMVARWSISEHERHALTRQQSPETLPQTSPVASTSAGNARLDSVRLNLMGQLTQELRNPLTSITGMASMLSREIYGPLTPKQQEYANILRRSSQLLLSLVDEIIELGSLRDDQQPLAPTAIDMEMLGQQALNPLESLAQQHDQTLSLTVEPGSRVWTLDRTTIKQLIYHLAFSVIQLSGEGGTVRIHASQREDCLSIAVWLSHPWLGEGLPTAVLSLNQALTRMATGSTAAAETASLAAAALAETGDPAIANGKGQKADQDDARLQSREALALLLSHHLAERHGGHLTLQGTAEAGYRFVAIIPPLSETEAQD